MRESVQKEQKFVSVDGVCEFRVFRAQNFKRFFRNLFGRNAFRFDAVHYFAELCRIIAVDGGFFAELFESGGRYAEHGLPKQKPLKVEVPF